MKAPTVYLHPVACPKANVDREKLAALLEARSYRIVDSPAGATFAIVFGCAFIDDAKRESIDDILRLGSRASDRPEHLIVAGCMPEKYGEEMQDSLPEVDAFVGNSGLGALPEMLTGIRKGKRAERVIRGAGEGESVLEGARRRIRPALAPWTRTVLIGDGCDNECTYCSIPHMRGRLRSRSIESIIGETDLLVEQGAKEVVLAGQDTASFGRDRERPQLPELLSTMAERYPEVWIRLSYTNPDNLDSDVAGVIGRYANICNYLDLPIQHASPPVLKAMGRDDRIDLLDRKIADLRKAVPDIALRTSVIIGFPGETEDDLGRLLGFLGRVEFDMVGVFAFSPQPGTPAADLPDRVPDEIVQARIVEVVSLQEEISHSRMQMMIGREVGVLVEDMLERGEKGARSQYDMAEVDRIIRIRDCRSASGAFSKARIDSVAAPYEWSATEL